MPEPSLPDPPLDAQIHAIALAKAYRANDDEAVSALLSTIPRAARPDVIAAFVPLLDHLDATLGAEVVDEALDEMHRERIHQWLHERP